MVAAAVAMSAPAQAMPPADLLHALHGQLRWSWFHAFYGSPLPQRLSVAVDNIGSQKTAHGRYTHGDTVAYAYVSVPHTSAGSMTEADKKSYATLLLHEFSHPFVNHLVDSHNEKFRRSGEALFAMVEAKMRSLGYRSWTEVLGEALVRATVIKYHQDHGESQWAARLLSDELRNGFFWIGQLVNELHTYDRQRHRYPTLESYLPRLAAAHNALVAKAQPLDDSKTPVAVSIDEFTNGDTHVSAALKTITVSFSSPLSVVHGSKGKKAYPKVNNMRYANSKRSVVLEVSLEADTEYELHLVGEYFTSVGGIGVKEYALNFRTAE